MAFIKIDELTTDNGDVVLLIRNLISQSAPKYPKGRTGTANSLLLIQLMARWSEFSPSGSSLTFLVSSS